MSGASFSSGGSSLGTTLQGSGPVTLASAAVAGTYGAYVQLIAALAGATKTVTISLTEFTGAPGGAVKIAGKLAVGPGGSEVDVPGFPHILTLWSNLWTTSTNPSPLVVLSGLQLSAGSRLAFAIVNLDVGVVVGCKALVVCVE